MATIVATLPAAQLSAARTGLVSEHLGLVLDKVTNLRLQPLALVRPC